MIRNSSGITATLESYREDRKPAFKSDAHHFTTVIYSMEYEAAQEQIRNTPKLSSDQAVTKLVLSNDKVVIKLMTSIPDIIDLLKKMVVPMSAKDMRKFCNQKHPSYFRENVIDPLIAEGLIAMTQPDSPKSPKQKYYLTAMAKEMLKNEVNRAVFGIGV